MNNSSIGSLSKLKHITYYFYDYDTCARCMKKVNRNSLDCHDFQLVNFCKKCFENNIARKSSEGNI